MIKNKYLIVILFTAAILRLWGLGQGDPLGDEGDLAFRAIGMLDFDAAAAQTTPLEWLDPNIPSWTKLSFHDHPPLVFLIQNIFIKIFGESTFGFRLPSAILGVLSIYLIYLIGRLLFSERVGLLAALTLALTANHVFISRVGLQESYVIFFISLAVFLLLKSLKSDKYLIWTGAAIGLGLLAKYTAFILAPIFLFYLLLFRRDYFLRRNFWLGILAALIIFSPVIIYNIKLYQAVGHFDFQISYLLGQKPEVWQSAPGKEEIGTLTDRLKNFIPNLIASNSWLLLILFALTIPIFLIFFFKNSRESFQNKELLTIAYIFLIFLMLIVGPTRRFLTLLTPFFAMNVALLLNLVYEKFLLDKKISYTLLGVFIAFEGFYSINSQIVPYPVGPSPWAYSEVRFENYNWGYNELDKFLKSELKSKMPALTFETKYQFLEDIKARAILDGQDKDFEPYPALLIYDDNIFNTARLWIFDRLQIYHGWPIADAENYFSILREKGNGYFQEIGIKHFYFIMPTGEVPLRKTAELTNHGINLEQQLIAREIVPETLTNKRGEEVFRVYKF